MRAYLLAGLLAASMLAGCATPNKYSGNGSAEIEELQKEQTRLIAEIRFELALMKPTTRPSPDEPEDLKERREKYKEMTRQLAEIEKRISDEKAGRTRYLSPSTRDIDLAVYYDDVRRRIEKAGTADFPKVDGKSIYGTLVAHVTIAKDGSLERVEIVKSTSDFLSKHTDELLYHLAPFKPFPVPLLKMADRVVITSSFKYVGH